MAKRTLLCIYQHAPTPGAPGIYRHRTLLAELVRRGWRVDLVSSPINYMTGSAPERYARRWLRRERIDGIHHHWVRATADVHRSIQRRALNYSTFAASAVSAGLMTPRPDVIWASSPPLSVGAVGDTLSHLRRRPWVFEVRDLWPESAASVGWVSEDGLPYRAAERLAHRYARTAQGVIVPTPGLATMVRAHGAVDPSVITGSLAERDAVPGEREAMRAELGLDDDTLAVVYVGAHGTANGLDTTLDAAKQLAGTPIRFVFAGDGGKRTELEARVAQEQITNVTMLGSVPKEQVLPLLSAADVCLHALRDDPLFASALPTKVLEYFGAHRPFITTVHGLPEQLARASGGAFAPTADTLAQELRRWSAMSVGDRTERGERSYAYGREHFGLEPIVDRLEATLLAAIDRGFRG